MRLCQAPGLSAWSHKQRITGVVGMEWPADTGARLVCRLVEAASTGNIVRVG